MLLSGNIRITPQFPPNVGSIPPQQRLPATTWWEESGGASAKPLVRATPDVVVAPRRVLGLATLAPAGSSGTLPLERHGERMR